MTNLINLNILLFPRLIMDYFQLLTMILYFGMLDRMREFFIQRQSNIDAVIETNPEDTVVEVYPDKVAVEMVSNNARVESIWKRLQWR